MRIQPDTAALTGRGFGSRMARIGKLAGAALAAGFVIQSKKAVETTQDLTKSTISLHKNLGLTNKVASEWAGVAKARGADTTKLGMAFKTLATQISAAGHGSTASVEMFERLGFSSADIERSMTDTQFAIGKVADGLNDLPPGADKATTSAKLFGRGWQTIAPVLRDGSVAMQEQLDTVEKYGGVLEGKTLKQQEELLANTRENKIAWQGMQIQLATALTPTLNKVADQFQRIAAINADPKLTSDEKWERITRILENDFNRVSDVIITRILPGIAEKVGETAPKIAGAFVQGFLNANVWGKVAIGAFLLSKFGGWAAIAALGKKIGVRLGLGIAAGSAAGGVVPAAGAAAAGGGAGGGAAKQAPKWLEKMLGGGAAGAAGGAAGGTSIGRLLLTRLGPPAAAAAAVNHWWFSVSDAVEEIPLLGDLGGFHGEKVKEQLKAQLEDLQPQIEKVARKPTLQNMSRLSASMAKLGREAREAGVEVPPVAKRFERFGRTLAGTAARVRHGNRSLRGLEGTLKGISTKKPQDAIDALRKKYGSLVSAGHKMSGEQRRAFVNMMQVARDNGDISQKQLERVTKAFDNNGKKWQRMMRRAADATGQSTKSMKRSVGEMSVRVSKDYDGMVRVTGQGLDLLTSNTNASLKNFGMGKDIIKWRAAVKKTPSLGHAAGPQKGAVLVPGLGVGDRVPLHLGGKHVADVESDELISVTNKRAAETLMAVNGAVPRFGGAGDQKAEIEERLRGKLARGGIVQRLQGGGGLDFALGPYTIPPITFDEGHAGTNAHVHISGSPPSWVVGIGHQLQRMGFLVGEHPAFGGVTSPNHGHYGPTDHWHGGAIDVNSAKALNETRGEVASIARLLNSGKISGAGAIEKLARVIIEPKGSRLQEIAQGGVDKAWKAANDFLAKQAPTELSGAVQGGWRGINSASEFIPFWNRSNPGLEEFASAFSKIVPAESTWNPRAGGPGSSNPTHAGWYQFDAPTWSDFLPKGAPGWPEGPYDPGQATVGAGNVARREGWGGVQSRWAQTYAGRQQGGVIELPSFGAGGTVPGPRGEPRIVIAHGKERIESDRPKQYRMKITNWDEGLAIMQEVADDSVEGRRELDRTVDRMHR